MNVRRSKILRTTLLALTLALPSVAQAQCAGPSIHDQLNASELTQLAEVTATQPYGEGLYWRATKGGTRLSIIGTVHLPDPRLAAVANRVMPDLLTADLMLVEATAKDQRDLQDYLTRNPDRFSITSGPTLPELLDEATWTALAKTAKERGIPPFMAAKFQPWFLLMTLSMPPCASISPTPGKGGLDDLLMTAATAPIEALEPWQNTLALLGAGTMDEQIAALRMGLMPADIQNAFTVGLLDSYFAGRTAETWTLGEIGARFVPGVDQAEYDAEMARLKAGLLDGRNHAWMPVITAAADTHDNVFIAFGAAHLAGENGVLQLLANAGWSIARLD